MAVPLTMTLTGRAEPRITALRLDGTPIPVAVDRTWSITVPVTTSVLALVATLADGRETTRVVQIAAVVTGGAA